MRRAILLLSCLGLGACTFEPGQGFAVVEPTVRAAFEPLADRTTPDGYQQLASNYQVHVAGASLRLSGIELVAFAGGSGGGFNPANPPPGYSLCHGGHCHRDDGALIPYEQIAAEAGGGGGSSTVVTMPVAGPLNLLAAERFAVECLPDCALPQTNVSQGRWGIESLNLEGTVRDARVPARFPGERRFRWVLSRASTGDAPAAVLDGTVDLPSDRSTPPRAKLDLNLVLTARLFDAVDWSTLTQGSDGVVEINGDSNAEVHAALKERLATVSPEAEVTRGER
ncbi:hypothetical protein ATI61_102169 [Archangium gephyra]|uniref:Lipoprotein n=1 Tax=Archangium gephyra TaxID=48 RepID=A0AAC8TGS3_9BACT|nr:hypothetical protein [Archangium gephyra]AKJ05100.1 putative lipoprotein [Archangium gephyra]REG35801.1 hypothetical protein ATI61_102169 [Archangium gephyra]